MLNDVLILLAGLACAGIGGEFFIRGSVGIARWARIPASIIGATIAAFATSSPELSVAISSGIEGNSSVALGNAIGANVANLGAILGIALLISRTIVEPGSTQRDLPVALLAPVVTAVMAIDGTISRLDGAIMLVLFATWLTSNVIEALRSREAACELPECRPRPAVLKMILGLGLLYAAGTFIVDGAVGIAQDLGLSAFVISATIVSIGTTIPEMVTTVAAKLKGQQGLALGVVLGSNIFNGLFIVGVAATISPTTSPLVVISPGLIAGAAMVALIFPGRGNRLPRRRGALLLALYIVFIIATIQAGR